MKKVNFGHIDKKFEHFEKRFDKLENIIKK